ncbi:hypothetical protein ABT160_29130 [Streptomyces sp. NPDC001941]|uniref:DUF7489 domain-containing protein n=1 Tax=Streptomyces sp. NPDC001941 TaxID=3154659 RepID=UPI00331A4DE1
MFKSHKVRERDVWDGVVVDKSRGMTDGSSLYHYVEVRLQDGTTKKARIDGTLWESLSEGDRLVKEAGTKAPVKA